VSTIQKLKVDHIIIQYVGYSFSRLGAPFWLSKFLDILKKYSSAKIHLFVHETYIRREKNLKTAVYSKLQKMSLKQLCGNSDFIYSNLTYYQTQVKNLGFKCRLCPTPSNLEYAYKNTAPVKPVDKSKVVFMAFGNRDYTYAL